MNIKPQKLELLAPARNAEIAIEAIKHGADAIYMGAGHHGARHAAANTLEEITRAVDFAHSFGAKIYITVNTLVYDNEIKKVEQLIYNLYHLGVDALIVQDMALLKMDIPPIALHASTQCDISSPAKARFLESAGFSQLVLAREMTLGEIAAIREVTSVPLEAFVHGALCVSYSGNCQASNILTGRSANRGECSQICRLPYDLIDGNGDTIISGKHLLSLRDMNRLDSLEAMIHAGISSFKIEGRLKDLNYVKTVVAAYRTSLDRIIGNSNGALERSSIGHTTINFTPSLSDTFNRGYIDYFLHSRRPDMKMASFNSPKSIGIPVGKVKSVKGRYITVISDKSFNNGDGFTYLTPQQQLKGFRANRVDGATIIVKEPVEDLRAGTTLFRNLDMQRESIMARETATRAIDVDIALRILPDGRRVAVDISLHHDSKCSATVTADLSQITEAQSPQSEARRNAIAKLGGTPYRLATFTDTAGNTFIPLSLLTTLRREAVIALDSSRKASYKYEYRKKGVVPLPLDITTLTYSDNVANHLATDFYRDLGATHIDPAVECRTTPMDQGTRVMLTRYCLRRELGYCLRTPKGSCLKAPLKLRANGFELDIRFNCSRCEMSLHTTK